MRRGRTDKVIVSLISVDGTKELFSRCLPTITVQDLKSKWRQEHGPRRGDILLRTPDGAFPTDDLPLNAFYDCSNPSQVIELTILSGRGVWVCNQRDSKLLPAGIISKTPQQILVQIRELFHFPVNQDFRLRSSDRILVMDRTLMDQGITPGCQVEIDKKNIVVVKDMWNDGQELQLQLFESQTLSEALPPSWMESGEQLEIRSESGYERIQPNTLIRDLCQSGQVKLQADRSEEIPLLFNNQICRPALTAGDQPRSILPGRTGAREVVAGQSQNLVPTSLPLGRVPRRGQRGHPFFHVDPLRVMYREGEKKTARFKVLRLPRGSLSKDLRQNRLAAGRTAAREELIVDGAGKDLEAKEGPLGAVKDGARMQLKLGIRYHHVRVVTGGRTLEWTEQRDVINFSEFTGQVAMLSRASPLEVLRRAFRCAGCGRKICREEEEYQMIPAACCRERSLFLLEVNDKSTQTRFPRSVDKECGTDDSLTTGFKRNEVVIAEQESGAHLDLFESRAKEIRQAQDDPAMRPRSPSPTPSYRESGGIYGYSDLSSLSRTTDSQFFDDGTTVEVVLHFPTEHKGTTRRWKKDVTLKRVIDDIFRHRPYFPVIDIIVDGKQLNTGSEWRSKTVAECNIRNGAGVVFEVGHPDNVTILTMHVDGFHDRENIPLDINEWNWSMLWERINFFFATDGKLPIVFISMNIIDRLGKPPQRAIRSGSLMHGIVANYDESTGQEVIEDAGRDREVATTYANELLSPTSGFRAPPSCAPILHIHPICDVLRLQQHNAPITQVCIEKNDDILFDVESVAIIWGLRSKQGRSENWQLYLEHGDGTICNVEHGNTFEDISSLPAAGNDVHRAVLVLRNGDSIPFCRTSPNTPVKVWTRSDVHYSIQGRQIKVSKSDKTYDALWILTRAVGPFQRNFTEVMGRRIE